MGREVRRVPPSWEHPKNDMGHLQPMHDQAYEDVMAEWIKNHLLWMEGKHPDQLKCPEDTGKHKYFAQWDGNAPDVEYYRPKWDVEPTWFQIYETVSEGTPCTPPFETKEELIEYIVQNGLGGIHSGVSRAAAVALVNGGWCPSFALINGNIVSGPESLITP